MGMRMIVLAMLTSALAFGAITMSDAQIKKIGITVQNVRMIQGDSMGPFIGTFDYGDERSSTYTLSSEATVVNVAKKPGDTVKKGEVVCRIASAELLASSFELKEVQQRLAIAREYAKKDDTLYRDGVLSQRDAQRSALEVMSLKAKVAEITGRFQYAGADIRPSEGMMFAIRSKRAGIVSQGPLMGGEKIEAFVPYLKISDASLLNAVIMIPPKLIASIRKGSKVSDKNGNVIGSVISVSASVNRMNNSGSAVARIAKPDVSFRAGTSAEMYIAAGEKTQWVLLPRTSVTKYKNRDICFIRTAKGFEPKPVEIQKYFKEHVAVKADGFTPQSRVVSGGIITLKGALSGMGFE
jgi:hypothetical protein